MNNRLYDRCYLAGDEYTIADNISYPWSVGWESRARARTLREFPYFELSARPGVQRGMAVGNELSVDFGNLSKEEISRLAKLLYNQRARPAPAGGLL